MINFELRVCKNNENSIIILKAIIEMTNTKCFTGEEDRNEGKTSLGSGARLTSSGATENNEEPLFFFFYKLNCNKIAWSSDYNT